MTEIADEELAALQAKAALADQLGPQVEQLTAQAAEAETTKNALAEAQTNAREATEAARSAIIAANPLIPADLITGDSIGQINQSLAAAQAIVNRLAEAAKAAPRQPFGFPMGGAQRQPPDTANMTPHQKIAWGIEHEREQHSA
jgi:hypothetical protein